MINRFLILYFALNFCSSNTTQAATDIQSQCMDLPADSYIHTTTFEKSMGFEHSYSSNISIVHTDSCQDRIEFIRETIIDFIKGENEKIFNERFLVEISMSNNPPWECFFPNNKDDIALLYSLGDSLLLEKAKFDERAMMLIVDIYLLYGNSPELAEYYGLKVIPEAAIVNTASFIKVLSLKTDNEINKCIRNMRVIEDPCAIKSINNQINQLNKTYKEIGHKISETIIH